MALFCQELFFFFKKSHAHLQYACNICAKFQIDCLKTLGGVDYINFLRRDGQMDRGTDGHGQNIMPSDYRRLETLCTCCGHNENVHVGF